ncbi:hypothetical protein RDWZM_003165 [Blomia tropicalis]|uniref:SET domain-containing protein n=1 Tax=Blomia tropicalis TaxID=40697 RepID=A0A9Q0RSF1_BLOTA|nr:hypothetical protein RDWZM_003165 [Blomia tropicalis]
MDPILREKLQKNLLNDDKFATLNHPREMFDYIWMKHINVLTKSNEQEWLQQQLLSATERMTEWSEKKNRKSYTQAKKFRNSARKVLELMCKVTAMKDEKVVDSKENCEFLTRAEKYYSDAIVSAPYVSTENIGIGMDKLARLKANLYQERAEIRYRSGKYELAIVDIALALHNADQIAEQYDGYEDLKVIAIKCFAELKMIEPDMISEVLDYVTNTHSKLYDSDGDDETENENERKTRSLINDSLNDLIVYNGHVSNYNVDNAPQLVAEGQMRETYFRYQMATNQIEIRDSPTKGRHFVAIDDIAQDTWILSEKPFSMVVSPKYLSKNCNLCLRELDVNDGGYPCDFCNEARFCCLTCFEEAYHTYHRHECGFLGLLLDNEQLSTVHVFRIINEIGVDKVLQYERLHGAKSYTVHEYLKESDLRTKTSFELNNNDRFTLYRMSTALAEHSRKYIPSMNVYQSLQAFNLALILLVKRNEQPTKSTSDMSIDREILLELFQVCFVYIRRVSVNVFGKFDYEQKNDRQTVATAEILIGSLINHSCEPNVEWQIKSGHLLFRTNRMISKGEELNITYGQTRVNPFQTRQNALQYYCFLCNCKLCRAEICTIPNVARCLRCNNGPLVVARGNAGCLDCHENVSPDSVIQATAEIEKTRKLLHWYHKMMLYSEVMVVDDDSSSKDFRVDILSMLCQIESKLLWLAFRENSSFHESLRSLAEINLQFNQMDRAMELCKLYEQCSSFDLNKCSKTDVDNPIEDRLVEFNFWSELCRKYFNHQLKFNKTLDERSLQVTILLFVRYLKLATKYIADRLGQVGLTNITITDLGERPEFSDVNLVFTLSQKKKNTLTFILNLSKVENGSMY